MPIFRGKIIHRCFEHSERGNVKVIDGKDKTPRGVRASRNIISEIKEESVLDNGQLDFREVASFSIVNLAGSIARLLPCSNFVGSLKLLSRTYVKVFRGGERSLNGRRLACCFIMRSLRVYDGYSVWIHVRRKSIVDNNLSKMRWNERSRFLTSRILKLTDW